MIVLAIIAILIALLMPMIKLAREHGRYARWRIEVRAERLDGELIALYEFDNEEEWMTAVRNIAMGGALEMRFEYIGLPGAPALPGLPGVAPTANAGSPSQAPWQPAFHRYDQPPTVHLTGPMIDPAELDLHFGDGVNQGTFPEWTEGRWDTKGAVYLNGDTYLQCDHHPALNLGPRDFTIAMWVKPEALSGTIVHKSNGSGTPGWSIYFYGRGPNLKGGGNVFFRGQGGPNGSQDAVCFARASISSYETQRWIHIAITQRGLGNGQAVLTMYIDGKPASASFHSGSGGVTAPLIDFRGESPMQVGTGPSGHYFGKIDELAIWARELPARRIARLYEVGKPNQ